MTNIEILATKDAISLLQQAITKSYSRGRLARHLYCAIIHLSKTLPNLSTPNDIILADIDKCVICGERHRNRRADKCYSCLSVFNRMREYKPRLSDARLIELAKEFRKLHPKGSHLTKRR